MAISQKYEVRPHVTCDFDRTVKARRDVAVALPRHVPVKRRDRTVDRGEVIAKLDRLEEQEAAPFGEDAEANARAARQPRDQLPQAPLRHLETGEIMTRNTLEVGNPPLFLLVDLGDGLRDRLRRGRFESTIRRTQARQEQVEMALRVGLGRVKLCRMSSDIRN